MILEAEVIFTSSGFNLEYPLLFISASFYIPFAMAMMKHVLERIASFREFFLCFGDYPGPFDPGVMTECDLWWS